MHIKEYLPVLFQLLGLEVLLYLIGKQPVQPTYGSRIHFKCIAFTGYPFGKQIITLQVQRVAHKVERDILPQRVHFQFQMESGGIYACHRLRKRQSKIIIYIDCRRGIHIYSQEFRRLGLFHLTFFQLLLFLLTLFLFLFLRFLLLFLLLVVCQLRQHIQSIGTGHQLFQAIRIQIGDTHFQGILLIEQGILYPIMNRIVPAGRLFYNKRIFLIKVQSFQ